MIKAPATATPEIQQLARDVEREFNNRPTQLRTYAATVLPKATAGGIIIVTGSTPNPVLAFADGANWRKSTDGSVI